VSSRVPSGALRLRLMRPSGLQSDNVEDLRVMVSLQSDNVEDLRVIVVVASDNVGAFSVIVVAAKRQRSRF